MGDLDLALDSFLTAAPDAERARWAQSTDDVRAEISKHLDAARSAWPDVELSPAHFAAELARRLQPDATAAELARLAGADLYLAIACGDGDGKAIAHCERAHFDVIDIVGSQLRATPDQVAEVRSQLRRMMFTAEPGRLAGTTTYAGRGDLRGYVRVSATRALVRMINDARREVPFDPDAVIERLGVATDPELTMLKATYREIVGQALADGLVALDDRSRSLLRYHIVDGLTIDDLGALYDVHRTTAYRWLEAARRELGERIREALGTRLRVAGDEIDSVVRLVLSRVEVSLARLLVHETSSP